MATRARDPQEAFTSNGEVPGDLAALRAATTAWREGAVAKSVAKMPPRRARFATWSDLDMPDVLTPADVPIHAQYMKELGLPGEYPFTRGVQP
ncbi:MAG TPA: hypothetical protein VIF62_19075, partial [Labilithrix sp.]